ncbi:hypothetical protein U1707_10105 [Sphingomonas sp. PB2P12]|uniref:hypothetical protein n=1 Tax=Sphingomonas sandaracina TaxID=3096157 RepID=UPI002FC587C3
MLIQCELCGRSHEDGTEHVCASARWQVAATLSEDEVMKMDYPPVEGVEVAAVSDEPA